MRYSRRADVLRTHPVRKYRFFRVEGWGGFELLPLETTKSTALAGRTESLNEEPAVPETVPADIKKDQ
jgi:hypothetical protein